jgi:hypothetical protein
MENLTCPYCKAVCEEERALLEHFCEEKTKENS